MSSPTQVQHEGALSTPWPYLCVALASALTSLVTFVLTLILGVVVGVAGAARGALSNTERGRVQGVHTLLVGLSLLVGPSVYLVLAIAR
jgi:hypothetical protein